MKRPKSAWVLYPGETTHTYPDEHDASGLGGVGAFPALPGKIDASLVAHLVRLLGSRPAAARAAS